MASSSSCCSSITLSSPPPLTSHRFQSSPPRPSSQKSLSSSTMLMVKQEISAESPSSSATPMHTMYEDDEVENSSSNGSGALPVRKACNLCRSRKVRCDRTPLEAGGCARCKREGVDCCYATRDPIGRPRKRKSSREPEVEGARLMKQSPTSSRQRSPAATSFPYASSSSSIPVAAPPFSQQQQRPMGGCCSNKRQDTDVMRTPSSSSNFTSRSNSMSSTGTDHTVTPASSLDGRQQRSRMISPQQQHQQQDQANTSPTLVDLGLAAFLQSLDTLELSADDGLTPTMVQGLHQQQSGSGDVGLSLGESPMPSLAMPAPQSLAIPAMSHLNQTAEPADSSSSRLSFSSLFDPQVSTSYAVPSDLSWADPGWLLNSDLFAPPSSSSSAAPMPTTVAATFPSMSQQQQQSSPMLQQQPQPQPLAPMAKQDANWQGLDQIPPRQDTTTSKDTPAKTKKPCPKTGESSCCCSVPAPDVPSLSSTSSSSLSETESSPPSSRVHCVPNPTGKGCTCLCDVSVSLINVRATLRAARSDGQEDESAASVSTTQQQQQPETAAVSSATTLQLTLSASQAVAAQCACSASCPTCRADPTSTSLSASLLVSTALQIYVRAVRTLRQGFGSGGGNGGNSGDATREQCDVSIGDYRPKRENARRIALFAMKLELRDLRDAIAKVAAASASATASNTTSKGEETAIIPQQMNPIDQMVIRKLHQQLGDLLATVEGLEEQF